MKNEIRLVIADDHPTLRAGLRQLIETETRFKIVAEVSDGVAALERITTLKPEIAILDIEMPGLDGLALAGQIRAQQLPVEIVFFTSYRKESYLQDAVELDVKGYLLKDSAPTDILSCLRAVARGEHYTSPAVTSYLVKRAQHRAPLPPPSDLQKLTPTERAVLRRIGEYKTSKEIADDLGMNYRTVETHRSHMIEKLELEGSHALLKFAILHQAELSEPPDQAKH